MSSKIIGEITGDYTEFRKKFDCTDSVLKLSLHQLRDMADHDYQSDLLAPEELIEEARIAFESEWGPETKDIQFGYEVTVVDSILEYFGVQSLDDITRCKLCDEFISIDSQREHLECHNPNARTMDNYDVMKMFDG